MRNDTYNPVTPDENYRNIPLNSNKPSLMTGKTRFSQSDEPLEPKIFLNMFLFSGKCPRRTWDVKTHD